MGDPTARRISDGKRFIVLGLFEIVLGQAGGEAHGLKHGHGRIGLERGQEVLGGILLPPLSTAAGR